MFPRALLYPSFVIYEIFYLCVSGTIHVMILMSYKGHIFCFGALIQNFRDLLRKICEQSVASVYKDCNLSSKQMVILTALGFLNIGVLQVRFWISFFPLIFVV